jgi:hypothetical protein
MPSAGSRAGEAAEGGEARGASQDYRRALLPEKRKWSESDQVAASSEWQQLKDKVQAASSTVTNGGVSDVLVSFRGRVAARREMGKSLCFLSIHSLHRGSMAEREEANWQVQGKGETLQALVDLSRWYVCCCPPRALAEAFTVPVRRVLLIVCPHMSYA